MRSECKRPVVAMCCLVLLLGATSARAEVTAHALFTDNMVLQRDREVPVFGFASDGEKVVVRLQDQERETIAANGKWQVRLGKLRAGGPYELTISGPSNRIELKNVLIGEVWICSGQSNMWWPISKSADPKETAAKANYSELRLYTVDQTPTTKPRSNVVGKWEVCTPETAMEFSAVAYHFGRYLQQALKVPVGLIHTSWGGTPAEAWTSRSVLESHPELKELAEERTARENYAKAMLRYEEDKKTHPDRVAKAKAEGKEPPLAPRVPAPPDKSPNNASNLYNGMIAPLIPYAIRGAIWYQGESNAFAFDRAFQYRALLPAMIQNWREDWQQGDFPFLIVQLAPYTSPRIPDDRVWAVLREAQLMTTRQLPKVGLAVITDVGHETDIHPQQKEPVGQRLALAARALAYGEKIEYSGPIYNNVEIDGNKAILRFRHIGRGLEARGGRLNGFTIAGADKKFVEANAEIKGDTVIVASESVSQPVAVRYGWTNYPVVNLWNKDGLPASPFRTDVSAKP